MQTLHVNDYDMAFLDIGSGAPLVCVHDSLCDFRVWSPVLGPLTRAHRVIAVSLRHCFPEHWDGVGDGYSIEQHIKDVIAFIEALQLGPVDLMGHSRGGYVAFRVALARPDLVRKLVLAEPGAPVDASLVPDAPVGRTPIDEMLEGASRIIAKGDVDGGLTFFLEKLEGPGAWRRVPPAGRQMLRDNAMTLIGQAKEERRPFTRADAQALAVPTLFICGAMTKGFLPQALHALAEHVPNARIAMIPRATHPMFEQNPEDYCTAVLEFLGER